MVYSSQSQLPVSMEKGFITSAISGKRLIKYNKIRVGAKEPVYP
jgi:hypothetical protein